MCPTMHKNVSIAAYVPTFPIWSANTFSFYCNGVAYASPCICFLSTPYWLCIPVASTTIFPLP